MSTTRPIADGALRDPVAGAGLTPFWISLAALWLAGAVAAMVYPWPAAVECAFLVEGSFFLLLGFPGLAGRLKALWSSRRLALMLCASAVIPYAAYSLPEGVFEWKSLGVLAALGAAAAFWFLAAPRSRWADAAFLALVAGAAMGRLFPELYAPAGERIKVDFLGQMMWRRVAMLSVLLFRPVPGAAPGFLPGRREWIAGAREFLFFAPFGAVLGLATGFVRFSPPGGEPWRVALIAAGTFLGMLWFVALTEEFFFRGLLQQWLGEWFSSRLAGLVAASLVFGAAHLAFRYPPLNWRFAVVAAAAGFFYGRAFERGGLRAAMVTHALVNVTWRTLFATP